MCGIPWHFFFIFLWSFLTGLKTFLCILQTFLFSLVLSCFLFESTVKIISAFTLLCCRMFVYWMWISHAEEWLHSPLPLTWSLQSLLFRTTSLPVCFGFVPLFFFLYKFPSSLLLWIPREGERIQCKNKAIVYCCFLLWSSKHSNAIFWNSMKEYGAWE